ncbi:MAG: hypothetical protein R6U01_10750 [Halorubrum sp.]|uniref:DUF7310 family coiled-coil domain-containing protein n=1 Tax=Halorubrum sp. TaxID=1879286 RepID=UPI003970FC78
MSNATNESDRRSDRGARLSAADAGGSDGINDADRLDERLRAVERALTGSDATVAEIGDDAAAAAEREALESRVSDLESRVEELEAATQAIRGYVGSIRAVNREVERRADLALARASCDGDGAPHTEVESETASDGAGGGVPADAVPSEHALDAALPAADAGRTAASATTDAGGASESGAADGSWRDEALNRLRESL